MGWMVKILFGSLLVLAPASASACWGPGADLGMIGSLNAIVVV
jgi:hypothetical protein